MLGAAFLLREGEEYLSTNWLEHFHPADRDVQLAGVRQALRDKGRGVRRTAFFLVLNAGDAIDQCRQKLNLEIRFVPLGERRDPSHTGIYGLTGNKSQAADALAQAVSPAEVHPVG